MTGKEIAAYFVSRRYDETVARLLSEGNTDDTSEQKRREISSRSLANAYLRMGEWRKASEYLQRVIGADKRPGADDYCEWGAAHWIGQQPDLAVDRWQEASNCQYGDAAGNLTPGLLLYYAGERLQSQQLKQQATDHLQSKLRTGWAKNWPSPLGRFLLNVEPDTHAIEAIAEKHPARRPDGLCQLHFYRGVKQQEAGDNEAARALFQAAIDIREQKTWTTEFVLASHEAGAL